MPNWTYNSVTPDDDAARKFIEEKLNTKIFDINTNDMTIKEVWQYGKEKCLSPGCGNN